MKKMRYLFWNTHKNKKINPILCNLISENHISIVVLAEYDADAEEEIKMLNTCGYSMQQYTTTGCERIHILAKEVLILSLNFKRVTHRCNLLIETLFCAVCT